MTEYMNYQHNLICTAINSKYKDSLPTEEDIFEIADSIHKRMNEAFPISDEEYQDLLHRLPEEIIHTVGDAETLRARNSKHQKAWYTSRIIDSYFWPRYRQYLLKKRTEYMVNHMDVMTDKIMNDLGDPKSAEPFQRRGLLLGDVQSGKTATYTAICNKAADAGYKVIIVLAGMMENLRVQTQQRLDAEFVGVDSNYTLDSKAADSQKNRRIGVGFIGIPGKKERRITPFTSVQYDFKSEVVASNNLDLNDLMSTALFVVKKNVRVLNNLYVWLTKSLAKNDTLNFPLLLIDDEADNASVNTNNPELDPTAINKAINNILGVFRQASYLGITATPFANIFIDPSVQEDGMPSDLFPRDFLTLLPSPDNYIGADAYFGSEDEAENDEDEQTNSGKGTSKTSKRAYRDAIIPIENNEQTNYFINKHKKELAYHLVDLPQSLYRAIRYFILATAISDLRHDNHEHRSMMINVTRFTAVQDKISDLVQDYVDQLRSAIQAYSHLSVKKADAISDIKNLHQDWIDFDLSSISGTSWSNILKNYLLPAIKRIEVRTVNQHAPSRNLDYDNYKETGMRVIAIGGNSLSRGVTLEGLCVSYFYRNTQMYDTLLQMGRWFGYRPNYADLCKIWMGEDAIGWYDYINNAFNELKDELRTMAKMNSTPENFGLKVRQNPGSLIVTARNKMRGGTRVPMQINLSSRLIETPRLFNDANVLNSNNELCEDIIRQIAENYQGVFDQYSKAYIWHDVPADIVIKLVSKYESHPWNLNFQSKAICDSIKKDSNLQVWDVGIPQGSDETISKINFNESNSLEMHAEDRIIEVDQTVDNMIRVNKRHVRVGAGGCAKTGLTKEQIDFVKNAVKPRNATDKDYLSVKNRKPILLIHLLHNKNNSLPDLPRYLYALSLGFPKGKKEIIATYIVNSTELEQYTSDLYDDDEDVD